VIYVCENNQYNEYTHFRETTAGGVAARAEAFGIPAAEVDGQDVLAVRDAAREAVARARRGDGPALRVCVTYRFRGHHVGDVDRSYYRTREEEAAARERDPIALLAARLVDEGQARPDELERIAEQAATEVEEGAVFGRDARFPDAGEVTLHVHP
jgi:pyruvate dehydrogenase E1 component alpha subunit